MLPSTWLPWKICVAVGGRSMCRHVSMLWKTSCAHPWIREMKCVWPDVWPTAWYGITAKVTIAFEICDDCATTRNGGPAKHTFCVSAGVERHVSAGQDALEKFETHLRPQGFTIRALTLDHQDPMFFKSYPPEGTEVLNVVLVNGHYMFIKNVARYFNKDYFCNLCCTPFDRRMRHRCGRLCQACKHGPRDARFSVPCASAGFLEHSAAVVIWIRMGSVLICGVTVKSVTTSTSTMHVMRTNAASGIVWSAMPYDPRNIAVSSRCTVLGAGQNHRARRSYGRRVVLHPIVKPWICWTRSWYRRRLTIVSKWSFYTLKTSKKR